MASRSASRKLDSPGIRTNQVYGMTGETVTPFQSCANGTYWCLPTHSEPPRASAQQTTQSSASHLVFRRRHATTRPNKASAVTVTPNMGRFSLFRLWMNSSASGTPVALGTCTGSAAQWTAAADRSLRSHGKCLSVSGSAKQSGAKEVLEPCAGYASQQWAAGTGAHLVNGGAGLCLSGSASGTTGSRVWLGACATGASRAWTLPAGAVQSQLPGECVASSSQASGAAVVIAGCSGLAAQQWTAQPDGTVRQAGLCLAVAGAGTASGTDVDLAPCSGGTGQQWQINPAGAGQQLVNPQSGLCLADPDDSTASGTQLVIASCTGGDPGTGWRLP